MSDKKFPCPCCGHIVFEGQPGSEDICLICLWEDDVEQLRWPTLEDGANAVSLIEAQRNFAKYGAIEERFMGDVRKPLEDEPLDTGFRAIQPDDSFEAEDADAPLPEDLTTLYYWRSTFWRRALTLS
jgi:hypothetical protein